MLKTGKSRFDDEWRLLPLTGTARAGIERMTIGRTLELRRQPRGLRRALEEDHAALDLLFEDMRNAIQDDAHHFKGPRLAQQRNQVDPTYSVFEARLRSHLTLEEEYILPAFSLVDPGEAAALRREHVELRDQLRQLGISLTHHLTRLQQALDLAKGLAAHAERENALIYRFTERRLEDPTARRTIAARLAESMMAQGPLATPAQDERTSQVQTRGRSMDSATRVGDIMTTKVIVLSEEDNLSRVAEGLEHFHFRHIPVVDGTKLVGMLSQHAVLRSAVARLDHSIFAQVREARVLEQTFVRDVMQVAVLTISAQELVQTAAERMLDEGIGALPVLSDTGDVIGIVTQTDVLRFVALRRGRGLALE